MQVPSNVIVVCGNEDIIEIGVCLEPEKQAIKTVSDGGSIYQVYAELGENFYTVWIMASSMDGLLILEQAANAMLPVWIEEVGHDAVSKCLVPDAWVEFMKKVNGDD